MAVALAGPAAASVPNLVVNGDFAMPGLGPTRTAALNTGAASAAPHWLVWNNDAVTTASLFRAPA